MDPICVDSKGAPFQLQNLYQLATQYHSLVTAKKQLLSAAHKIYTN